MSSVISLGSVASVAAKGPRLSSGNGSVVPFGQRSRAAQRQVDPLAFYARFPDRWMGFLRAHFRNPMEVAVFFDVTTKAAEKWWEGIGGPQGAKLGYALTEIDGAFEALFLGAA